MMLLHILCKVALAVTCCHGVLVSGFTTPAGTARRSSQPAAFFQLGPVARNGIGWNDVEIGDGRRVLPGDTVLVYYIGSYRTGAFGQGKETIFDRTTEGNPFQFVAGKGQVIKGWDLGVLGGLEGEISPMNVGGVRELSIPSGLAYGETAVGPIPANQDLEFKIQLLRAEKETDISLQYRLGGFAVALGLPAFILLIVYNFFVFH